MNTTDLFSTDPYSKPQAEKEAILLSKLSDLTKFHKERCPEYARLLHLFYNDRNRFSGITDIPYLPVNLFKTKELLSIPRDQVFKVLKSSGTSSSVPSKIFLDTETAQRQTMALANIMTSFLGSKRLPMLVVDHSKVIQDRHSYSARGAAIVGMLSFGRDVCYALDENMELNHKEIFHWLQKYQGQSILIFGLTFVIWKHFLSKLKLQEINIPNGILMHTGGWKKMEEQSIDNKAYKNKLYEVTDIRRCHNFYGMVEQVGSVFVECEHGYLHCPEFADIIIRDPKTWQECSKSSIGIIQALSILPTSYPGHSLLTEDLGALRGIDDCPCGRKGKFFYVIGRAPQAEIRGCSDTQ